MNIQNVQTTSSANADALERTSAPQATQAVDRSQLGAGSGAAASSGSSHAWASQSDQASLSLASQMMTQASSLPDVDMGKVSAVQNALAAGTYQVSSSDVAAKVIESMTR